MSHGVLNFRSSNSSQRILQSTKCMMTRSWFAVALLQYRVSQNNGMNQYKAVEHQKTTLLLSICILPIEMCLIFNIVYRKSYYFDHYYTKKVCTVSLFLNPFVKFINSLSPVVQSQFSWSSVSCELYHIKCIAVKVTILTWTRIKTELNRHTFNQVYVKGGLECNNWDEKNHT